MNLNQLENLSRTCLKKLESFIGASYNVCFVWNTTKIRSLFPREDKNSHPRCVIYEGSCECDEEYVGETDRCIHLTISEHEDIEKNWKIQNILRLTENILSPGKSYRFHRGRAVKEKSWRPFFISKWKPGLNEHVSSRKLTLFTHGATWVLFYHSLKKPSRTIPCYIL